MEHAKTPVLTVTLLGQAEVAWRGVPLDLPRRQTRALFYRLAVRPEALAREQLCFLFWPDVADAMARRNLTRLLTHLRRALPDPELLSTTSDSIRLNEVWTHTDSAEFERLYAEANQQQDTERLAQVVALYRGPFLDGFSLSECAEYEAWLTGERRTFERHYLQALTALIDLKSEQRDYAAAITYARQSLAHDELDEAIHRRLIELFTASGDRSAARRQFEECATVLERELAVDPLPETRTAYEAALMEHPPPLPQPVPTLQWTTLPSLDLPMAGREDAQEQLHRHFRRSQNGAGTIVLISGEAGVGKSRLMQEFATSLSEETLLLAGAGQPGGQTLPYHPVTQALRRGIHLVNRRLDVDPIWLAEASLVLPELRSLHPGLPAPLQTDPKQARLRLFEALTRITLALAGDPHLLLLCLDDLHWTDSATLAWIAYLSEQIRNTPLLLLGTYRKEEPDAVEPLRHHLVRQGVLYEVALNGLDANAVSQLLQYADPSIQTGDTLAWRLQQATGGNAFFLLETVRATLEEHTNLDLLHSLDDLTLPQTVAEAVADRLRRLSPVTRQVLEAGSILGLNFAYELIHHTAGRTESEVAEGLAQLVDHALLREDGDAFQFHHDILRRVVYQNISSWRRQLLHRRAGETLAEIHAADLDAVSGTIAAHYERAGESERAFVFYRRAAAAARRIFANQEALDYHLRALALLHTVCVDELTSAQLHEEEGDLLALLGRHEEARDAYQVAYGFTGELEIVRRARLKRKQGHTQNTLQNRAEAFVLLRAAEEIMNADLQQGDWGWSEEWFNVQRTLAEIHYHQARLSDMETILNRLHNIEQRATLEQKLSYYHLQVMLWNRQDRFQVSRRTVALVRTAYELAQETNSPLIRAEYTFSYGFSLLWHSETEAAIEYLETSLKEALDLANLSLQNRSLAYLSIACRLLGDRDRTSTYSERGLRTAEKEGQRSYIATARANYAWLHICAGDLDAALHEGRTAVATWGPHWYPFEWLARWPLLVVALERAQLADAVIEAEAMLHPVQQVLPPHLTTTFQSASDCWQRADIQTTTELLQQAVEIAHSIGHL